MLGLFRPYRTRLSAVLALIVVSAGLGNGVAVPTGSPGHGAARARQAGLLSVLVAGMIAIAIATRISGVYETLLSNQVGPHDSSVYRQALARVLHPHADP